MSDHEQPESRPDDIDLVFNDETCRALRKKRSEAARVLVPAIMVLLFVFSAALAGVLSVLGPRAELAVSVAVSLVFAKALVAELRWFDAVPTRETLREAWTEMNRDRGFGDQTDPNALDTMEEG